MLPQLTVYAKILYLLMMMIAGALCSTDHVYLYSKCSERFLGITPNGKVEANDNSGSGQHTIKISNPPDYVEGPLKLSLFIEEAQVYVCFNHDWRIVTSKKLHDNCYFYETMVNGYFQYQAAEDRTKHLGFNKRGRPLPIRSRTFNLKCINFIKDAATQPYHRPPTSTSTTSTSPVPSSSPATALISRSGGNLASERGDSPAKSPRTIAAMTSRTRHHHGNVQQQQRSRQHHQQMKHQHQLLVANEEREQLEQHHHQLPPQLIAQLGPSAIAQAKPGRKQTRAKQRLRKPSAGKSAQLLSAAPPQPSTSMLADDPGGRRFDQRNMLDGDLDGDLDTDASTYRRLAVHRARFDRPHRTDDPLLAADRQSQLLAMLRSGGDQAPTGKGAAFAGSGSSSINSASLRSISPSSSSSTNPKHYGNHGNPNSNNHTGSNGPSNHNRPAIGSPKMRYGKLHPKKAFGS